MNLQDPWLYIYQDILNNILIPGIPCQISQLEGICKI